MSSAKAFEKTELAPEVRETMNVVFVGHVDHGKSTLVGRILADTGTLGDGKLEKVQEVCRQQGKIFEYVCQQPTSFPKYTLDDRKCAITTFYSFHTNTVLTSQPTAAQHTRW